VQLVVPSPVTIWLCLGLPYTRDASPGGSGSEWQGQELYVRPLLTVTERVVRLMGRDIGFAAPIAFIGEQVPGALGLGAARSALRERLGRGYTYP